MTSMPKPSLRTHFESPGGLPACGVVARYPHLAYAQTPDWEDVDCRACLALRDRPLPVPARIRVYPENRSLYARVNVWPDQQAMYRHRPLDRDHSGSCTGQEQWRRSGKKSGLFAEVNLHAHALDIETVAHEMTHAAWRWAKRVGWSQENGDPDSHDCSNAEERFCYALGRMVRQFTDRARALGLYTEEAG
jgi:hypothetical protein